jgi:crossover junction endodeoxyribonuclease RuvC
MIILGIDPGYGRLGYAVFEKSDKTEKLLEYSCIETSPKDPYFKRILKITDKFEKIALKHKPDVLAIEKVFFNKNQKTALETAEVKGIIGYLALKKKMKVIEYTPLEVKTAVCGYGRAPKEQVQKMVNLLAGLKKSPKLDDTSDAIALCLTCAARREYLL